MFEPTPAVATMDPADLLSALGRVAHVTDDVERVTQLAFLERAKAVCAAAQARLTADLVDSQAQVAEAWRERARGLGDAGDFEGWRRARGQARAAACQEDVVVGSVGDPVAGSTGRATGGPAAVTVGERVGRCGRGGRLGSRTDAGVAAQVALARRESPYQGSRHVREALALVHEMPYVLAALEAGDLSERRAGLVVQETSLLTTGHRSRVDAELGALGPSLGLIGDKELTRRVQELAYRLDPHSVVDRARHAEAERRVTIRPAPDTMTWLTALLPAAEGVAVHAALVRAADTAKACGDPRGKGQVMADTLVTRVTGQSSADAVPVEVQVVMTDRTLLAGDQAPARLFGYGPVPATWARDMLTVDRGGRRVSEGEGHATDELFQEASVWLRRLYTHPADGTLVSMDSTRRVFEGGLRRFLIARDGVCRTPWCGAPIRHLDHIVPHRDGGPTTAENGQGLCARCNLVKELAGWKHAALGPPGREPGRRHCVEITTPTGHIHTSSAPRVLGEPLLGDPVVGEPGVGERAFGEPALGHAAVVGYSALERAYELCLAA